MKTQAGAVTTVVDFPILPAQRPTSDVEAAPGPRPVAKSDAPPAPEDALANVRLVIEEDEATGAFIYKTLDRTTGEVILQLPREDMLKALFSGTYAAGDVIKTRV